MTDEIWYLYIRHPSSSQGSPFRFCTCWAKILETVILSPPSVAAVVLRKVSRFDASLPGSCRRPTSSAYASFSNQMHAVKRTPPACEFCMPEILSSVGMHHTEVHIRDDSNNFFALSQTWKGNISVEYAVGNCFSKSWQHYMNLVLTTAAQRLSYTALERIILYRDTIFQKLTLWPAGAIRRHSIRNDHTTNQWYSTIYFPFVSDLG